jgi:hypothetical protein
MREERAVGLVDIGDDFRMIGQRAERRFGCEPAAALQSREMTANTGGTPRSRNLRATLGRCRAACVAPSRAVRTP